MSLVVVVIALFALYFYLDHQNTEDYLEQIKEIEYPEVERRSNFKDLPDVLSGKG